MKLVVTGISINFIRPSGNLVAFASITVNNALVLSGIGIHSKPGGYLDLGFPAKTFPNGEKLHYAHPINDETRILLRDAVAKKYFDLMEALNDSKP